MWLISQQPCLATEILVQIMVISRGLSAYIQRSSPREEMVDAPSTSVYCPVKLGFSSVSLGKYLVSRYYRYTVFKMVSLLTGLFNQGQKELWRIEFNGAMFSGKVFWLFHPLNHNSKFALETANSHFGFFKLRIQGKHYFMLQYFMFSYSDACFF